MYHFSHQRSLATELTMFCLENKTQTVLVINGLRSVHIRGGATLSAVQFFSIWTHPISTHTHTHTHTHRRDNLSSFSTLRSVIPFIWLFFVKASPRARNTRFVRRVQTAEVQKTEVCCKQSEHSIACKKVTELPTEITVWFTVYFNSAPVARTSVPFLSSVCLVGGLKWLHFTPAPGEVVNFVRLRAGRPVRFPEIVVHHVTDRLAAAEVIAFPSVDSSVWSLD